MAMLASATTALLAGPINIVRTNYHGWADSLYLNNGQVEVVVAPCIGRIMRLGFAGAENVLWENRSLEGKNYDGTQTAWVNLGGDKSWPSPEAEWGKYTGDKGWFPPRGFDGLPATARIEGNAVVLTHPLDTHYGIRTQEGGNRKLTPSSSSPAQVWLVTSVASGEFNPLCRRTNVFRNTNGSDWMLHWCLHCRAGYDLGVDRRLLSTTAPVC